MGIIEEARKIAEEQNKRSIQEKRRIAQQITGEKLPGAMYTSLVKSGYPKDIAANLVGIEIQ